MRLSCMLATLLLAVGAYAQAKPNVLFIAVDDLRPELGCFGRRALTPNIDKLATSGLRFERAYCQQAVCGASRTSLMTGLYPEATGERTYHVHDWRKRWAHVVTLNQHFSANQYTTVGFGKVYHGRKGPDVDTPNWTRWLEVKGKQYAAPESLKNLREKGSAHPGQKTSKRGPATEAADVTDDVYTDGQVAALGVQQIKKLAEAGKPFFLAVGFVKPHLPFNAPTKYWEMYKRSDFAMPDNLGIPPGYPVWASNQNAGELRAYSDIPLKGSPKEFPMDLNLRLIHGYHAAVSYTDRNVGMLLDALEKAGIADHTIVVLWGDHGWKLGDHSSWCKHTNFECDNHVPLLVRHPQMKSARGNTKALVEYVDLYPTLCELCGFQPPPHVQGKSFVPVLKDPASKHRDFAYSSYPHRDHKSKKHVVGHSIRNQQYRYTEWWEKGTDKVTVRALTDLTADPGETTNLLPARKDLADKLSKEVKKRVLAARKTTARQKKTNK